MGHKIVEAIIENGQLKYIDRRLPDGKLKVHLIYDTVEETLPENKVKQLVKETSGIYKNIDAASESETLRKNWERNAER